MIKKLPLLLLGMWLNVVAASAESEIAITTTLPVGSEFRFNPTLYSSADALYVDWGDGERVLAEVQTNSWGGKIGYVGEVKGPDIHLYGRFERLDLSDKQITRFTAEAQKTLEYLVLSKNLLENGTLDLEGAPNLTSLDVSFNHLMWLKVDGLPNLESLYANDNPQLNTIFIVTEGGKQTHLQTVRANNCDLTHFYPVSLPNLLSLNLADNSLWDIEIGEYYPELTLLNLSGNEYLSSVDVTKCPELYSLTLSHTAITDLNVSQNPELQQLYVDHTPLSKLSLKNNQSITALNVSNTGITKLDVSRLEALKDIYADSIALTRLNLRYKKYLRNVSIRATDIEWLDMHHAVGYNNLRTLDMRDCKRMTPQSLTFTFDAMPPHNGSSYQANVFIDGTDYATSKTDLLDVGDDNYFLPDVEGNGTCSLTPVKLTELSTTGGTYTLMRQGEWRDGEGEDEDRAQYTGYYSQYLPFVSVTSGMVIPGRPVRVSHIQPEEGMEYAGVEVNGQFIDDVDFVVAEAATVRVVFRAISDESVIRLTVPAGAEQQYFLAADEPNTKITVDWGDGEPVEYTIQNTSTYVGVEDGQSTSGTTVTIRGAVTEAIFDSYPYVATDNMITAIDLSGNTRLRKLSVYMNEIETLDVSHLTELEYLDCAYAELDELNISNNPKLTYLSCYGNNLMTLDVSHAPLLKKLLAYGNDLTTLDVSRNTQLDSLFVQNNNLTALDLTGLSLLEDVRVQNNRLTALDVSGTPRLYNLSVSSNQLTELNLVNNKMLVYLDAQGNHLSKLNASSNEWLCSVNVSNNGWDACTLDEFYASLPEYPLTAEERADYGFTITLRTNSFFYGSTTDYPANATATSTTSIATAKDWVVDYEGDGTGCQINGIDIVEGDHSTLTIGQGELLITTQQPTEVSIFNVAGARIAGTTVKGTHAVSLHKGIYVVCVGRIAKTVIVK